MGEAVGLFLGGLNDYQDRLKEDALKRAKHLGFDLDVQVADNDGSRQLSQIKGAIERRGATGLSAMLVAPVSDNELAAAGRAAAIAGLDWILLNRSANYLDSLRQEFPGRVIFTVLPDQTEIGRIQGLQVRALARPAERILCVTGRADTWSARLRLDGLKQAVGAANPIANVDGSWTTEGGRRVVGSWLGTEGLGTPIGALVAQNDDMALGAQQAVREAMGRGQLSLGAIPIVGCDGSPRFGQRFVREGLIACTVVVASTSGPALDWLRRARSGAQRPSSHIMLPVSSFPTMDKLSRRPD